MLSRLSMEMGLPINLFVEKINHQVIYIYKRERERERERERGIEAKRVGEKESHMRLSFSLFDILPRRLRGRKSR